MIRSAVTRLRGSAARIDAATPPHRDRTVDALRALAISGVIIGHWLVTALVLTSGRTGTSRHGAGGPAAGQHARPQSAGQHASALASVHHAGLLAGLHDASPLATLPALTPLSWIFQTLAIFFFVGGYAAARSFTGGYPGWLRKRMARLLRPVAVFAAAWAPLALGLYWGGVSGPALHVLLTLVLDPLWFLAVFAGLTALTPAAVALVRRFGARAALIPLVIVAGADAVRFGFGGPAAVGWINIVAGWMVPYLLGIAWAKGAFPGRRGPALMLAGGAAATVALVAWAGYPASMVGVNGAAISNLNPPTLAAVTFGIAQAGLALLVREPLARWMRRPLAWMAVTAANLSAMTLFLWHQTAFLVVTMAALAFGRLPGLHTAPASPLWVAERLGWLPVFAAVLAVLWIVFHRAERVPRPRQRLGSGQTGSGQRPRPRPDGAPGIANPPRPAYEHRRSAR
jgi:Acyltransferase family